MRVLSRVAEATGQPYERIERDTDRDYIMGPDQAIEYGIIDRVVSRPLEEVPTGAG